MQAQSSSPKIKRLGISVLSLICLAGVVQVLPSLVSTAPFAEAFKERFREATGREVVIRGKPQVTLFPAPMLYFANVQLLPREDGAPTPDLQIARLGVGASYAALFSDKPSISTVELEGVVIAIQRAKGKEVDWDWLASAPALSSAGPGSPIQSLVVHSGSVHYFDDNTDDKIDIEGIRLQLGWHGRRMDATSSFRVRELPVGVKGGVEWKDSGASVEFTLDSGSVTKVSLKGDYAPGAADERGTFKGQLASELEDVYQWLPKPKKEAAAVPQPIKLTAEVLQQGFQVTLDKLALESGRSTGEGQAELSWHDVPRMDLTMHFKAFDLPVWQRLAERLTSPEVVPVDYATSVFDRKNEKSFMLPLGLGIKAAITADQVLTARQPWRDAVVSAEIDPAGVLVINQLMVGLPGESNATLFGIMVTRPKGPRFEGNLEAKGKDLRAMLSMIEPAARSLPEKGFNDFYARSNLLITPEQVRVSEAELRVGELSLVGGLVAYFEDQPRFEAEMKLKDINFDHFRDAWREEKRGELKKAAGQKNALDKSGKKEPAAEPTRFEFDWLKKLESKIDFKIEIDKFHFLDKDGESASLRLYATQGELGLYGIKLYYPDSIMEGNFNLDVRGELPDVDLVLTGNVFDTAYFSLDAPVGAPQGDAEKAPEEKSAPREWSGELFDFSWMEGFSADLDLNLTELIDDDQVYENFKLKARLDKNALAVEKFSFGIWGGGFDAAGSLIGGRVPGLSASFTFYNAELVSLISTLSTLRNVTGRVSLSGALTTSGINMKSWVEQADAKIVMSGRGVIVNGLNLQGVIDAVNVARSVADVVNNVPSALTDAYTDFSVDGNLNIQHGQVRTPGITLKSGYTIGNLTGEINLIPWTMSLATLFQFPSFASETVPTMLVEVGGPVDAYTMKVDTASLEAYVAKRIISK